MNDREISEFDDAIGIVLREAKSRDVRVLIHVLPDGTVDIALSDPRYPHIGLTRAERCPIGSVNSPGSVLAAQFAQETRDREQDLEACALCGAALPSDDHPPITLNGHVNMGCPKGAERSTIQRHDCSQSDQVGGVTPKRPRTRKTDTRARNW